jgi:hypothetical protein
VQSHHKTGSPIMNSIHRNVDPLLRKQITKLRAPQVIEKIGGRDRVRTCDPCLVSRKPNLKSDSSYSFQFNEMARPAGLEPAAFCFEGNQGQILNACSGVAYEHLDAF